MKYLLLSLILSFSIYSQDRTHALNISNQLNTYQASSQSTNPDRAFAYRSNRDDVDDTEVFETTLDTSQFASSQIVVFTRAAQDSSLGATPSCDGDYGNVTIDATTITITTSQLPVRIRCVSDTGQHRVFYSTYEQ